VCKEKIDREGWSEKESGEERRESGERRVTRGICGSGGSGVVGGRGREAGRQGGKDGWREEEGGREGWRYLTVETLSTSANLEISSAARGLICVSLWRENWREGDIDEEGGVGGGERPVRALPSVGMSYIESSHSSRSSRNLWILYLRGAACSACSTTASCDA